MKKIGFDVDGVLADFWMGFTTIGNRMWGWPIQTHSECAAWDGGFTADQIDAVWQEILNSQGFWMKLKPLVGYEELERISDLMFRNHVYFITSRPDVCGGVSVQYSTTRWLKMFLSEMPTVIMCHEKAAMSDLLGLDFYIDDKFENVLSHNGCRAYLLDRPYNQNSPINTYTRIKSVSEYLGIVERG